MSESPLQKLLRLKREKENATVGTSDSNSAQPVQATEDGSLSSKEGSLEVAREVPEETPSPDLSNGTDLPANSSDPAPSVSQSKPLSAMERLKQLRSGNGGIQNANPTQKIEQGNEPSSPSLSESSSSDSGSSSGGSISSLLGSDSASASGSGVTRNEEETKEILKTSKTHPIAMEMAELEAALNAQVPGFVSILSTIHKKLKADPNVVTLLDEDEIRVIVSGLEKHTNVAIVAPSAAKAAKSRKKDPVSAMDL